MSLLVAGLVRCIRETSALNASGCEAWSPLTLLSFAEDLHSQSRPHLTSCLHQQAKKKKKPIHFTNVFANAENNAEYDSSAITA